MECITCRKSDTACLCFSCFISSDHRGHKFFFSASSNGSVCDCGDHNFFKAKGHCESHSGESQLSAQLGAGDVGFFKEGLMRLLAAMIFFLSFDPCESIEPDLYGEVMGCWEEFWGRLVAAASENQNVLMLILEVLIDKELLQKHLPRPQFNKMIFFIQNRIKELTGRLRRSIERILPEGHPGSCVESANAQMPSSS